MKKIRSGAIDYAKLIFAISIIGLHTSVFADVSLEVSFFLNQVFARLAVPFFFIASAYFLGTKIISCDNTLFISNYIKKYLRLFIIFSLLYSPLTFLWNYNSSESLWLNLLIYFQYIFFMAPAYMWYISALIFGVVLLKYLIKIPIKYGIIIVIILYVIGVVGNTYIFSVDTSNFIVKIYFQVFLTTRNGLFFATPFMYFGYLIAKFETIELKKIFLSLFLISVSAYIVEVYLVHSLIIDSRADTSMYFFLLPTSILLFLIIKGMNIKSCNFSFKASKISLYLYMLQFGFIAIAIILNKYFLLGNFKLSETLVFIFTVTGGFFIYYIHQKILSLRSNIR
jgi:hypothetical protein